MPKKIDLTGQRFGRLKVLYRNGSTSKGLAIWHCLCDCGEECDKIGFYLRNGNTTSCGCYQKESARNRKIKSNSYELFDLYGIGYDCHNNKFYFDIEDYDKIKDYCWFTNNDGYISAKKRDGSGKHVLMHQIVMEKKYIDHIGGHNTRNDNRKSNLRVKKSDSVYSFESINNMNKKIQSNNKSGCPGAIWHKRDQVWEVYLTIQRNQLYLGRFDNFDEAVKARKEAEEKYFGEYSYDNSQKFAKFNNVV